MVYNPPPVLFRQAMAMADNATMITDSCIVVIVLGHAAVESAWHHAKAQAGIAGRGWPSDFDKDLAAVASAGDRPPPSPVDPALWSRFELVQARRKFLQHGDHSSRERLRGAGGDPHPDSLTAEFVAEAVDVCRDLLTRTFQ